MNFEMIDKKCVLFTIFELNNIIKMENKSLVPRWSKKYNINIPEIDFQHQYFLKLIQRLEKRFEIGMSSHLTYRHFNEILAYADFHFQSEENIMILYNYPDILIHQEQHKELLDEIGTTLYYYKLGKKSTAEIIQMLVHWFLDHTVEKDSKFGEFIVEQKIQILD